MKYTREDLAINGGPRVKTTPNIAMFPGGLEIGEAEKKEVMEVLDAKYLFRYYGPEESPSKVKQLEEEYARYVGRKHCLAVNSCTSSLICGLIAVGVEPGDEVIVISSDGGVLAVGNLKMTTEEMLKRDRGVAVKVRWRAPWEETIIPSGGQDWQMVIDANKDHLNNLENRALGFIRNTIEKNKDKKHNFSRDPITLKREDDWIRADGTTLGSDNGIGLAKDFDYQETDSLGLKLVTTLVDQIEGKLENIDENGTKFRITFSIKK